MKLHWRQFLSYRQNLLALAIIGLFIFVALAARWIAPPDDPDNFSLYRVVGTPFDRTPHPPSPEYPLGTVPRRTDVFLPGVVPGQAASPQLDVFYTLVWGTRSALRFGLMVAFITATIGVLIGAVSAYAGGVLDGLLMRITDAFLVFPPIAAVWLFQRILTSQVVLDINPWAEGVDLGVVQAFILNRLHLDPIMLALIAFSWMPYARIINVFIGQLKQAEYVVAAQAIGASGPRIIWRHLLPNAISPAIVLAARDVGGLVILESAFTFIGFGGTVAWGVLLVAGRDYVIGLGGNPFAYWWSFLPASLALTLFGIGWNLLGDGLNVMLNPQTRRAVQAGRIERTAKKKQALRVKEATTTGPAV